MLCINKIYVIGTFLNGHRLYNAIRDLKLHFKEIDIQVCQGVNKYTININKKKITTDSNHFGKITETQLLVDYDVNMGHLACNISHMNVIHDALEKEYSCVLIAEDDLMLGRKANQIYEEAIKYVPDDRELLRLSWFPSPGINVQEVNKYRYKGDGVRGTELYMLNRKGIEKMYNNLIEGVFASFDAQLHKYKGINHYIIKYSLGIQWNNYDIDINAARENLNHPIRNIQGGYVILGKKQYLKFKGI